MYSTTLPLNVVVRVALSAKETQTSLFKCGKIQCRFQFLLKEKDIKELVFYLTKYNIDTTIINESPDPVGDSLKTMEILKQFK